MRARGEAGLAGAAGGLAAGTAAVIGMRSVLALEGWSVRSLLGLPRLPRETLGLAWSPRAAWPHELQSAAVDRLASLLAALFLATLAVALLNALVLLLEAGSARWRELAVRAAVGASPARLVRLLLGRVRRVVATGMALGLPLGLATGGALRWAWPGVAEPPHAADALALVLPLLAVAAGLASLAYVGVAFRTVRRGALAGALSTGDRAGAGPGAALGRRLLAAGQAGAAGAVLVGSLALGGVVPGVEPVEGGGLRLVPVTAPASAEPGHWETLLERVAAVPGVEAESLSAPGALVGLGVRDVALTQCGACSRGGLPLPMAPAVAHHHAVTPGLLPAAGYPVVSGRDLQPGDVRGDPVALVNETFARSSFEGGRPLGRKVRLGAGLGDWFTVVGVVADRPTPVVGGEPRPREAVWVNALRHEPDHAHLAFRGTEAADRGVQALLAASGYAPGPSSTLEAHRRGAAAPLRWVRRLAWGLSLATLLLALHGAHGTALQLTRRRVRELAVRRALGADGPRVAGLVLRGALGVGVGAALVTVFLGTLLVGLLKRAAAGVTLPGPGSWLLVVGLLVGASLLAAARAVREALAVSPVRALAGGVERLGTVPAADGFDREPSADRARRSSSARPGGSTP